jgi:TMEM175 potassium channel family protein
MTEATQRSPEASRSRDRDRIINLSDGVFAIAITLLILDIRVPDMPENLVATELPAALLALWPKYLGYLLSFVGISTFWMIHQSIFRPIRAYDRVLLYLNFVFLMVVAFVPFPTSLLGEYGNHQLPVAIYAATLAIGRLLLTAIHWYSTRDGRLLEEAQDPRIVRFFLIRGLTIPAIFLLSIGISFFSVSAAIWTWFIMLAVDAIILRRRMSH